MKKVRVLVMLLSIVVALTADCMALQMVSVVLFVLMAYRLDLLELE